MLTGCYWFCIMIWISTYTANLAAFFTVQNTRRPINNLEEALDSDYSIGVTMSSSDYAFLRSSKYELYKRVWEHMESKNTFASGTVQGIKWAREEKYVFISDGPVLKYEANKEPCDLETSKYFENRTVSTRPNDCKYLLVLCRYLLRTTCDRHEI